MGLVEPRLRSLEPVAHDAFDRVGRARDERLRVLLGLEPREYPVGDGTGIAPARAADADPQPQEVLGAAVRRERAQAVVAGEPAAAPRLQSSRLEIDVVVHHEQLLGLDLEEPGSRAHGTAGLVHVRLRLQQREARLAEPDLRCRPGELRAPRAPMPARELVQHEPAGVVARALVVAARVAQPRDEQIERRGPLAPTKQAHGALALGGAGLAGSVPAGLVRGLGGTLGSLLALRHLALGQLALLELL